jgi:hypothetical protein
LYAIRRQTSLEKNSSQTFRADVEMGNCLEFWSVAYLGLDDELFSDELGWDYFLTMSLIIYMTGTVY